MHIFDTISNNFHELNGLATLINHLFSKEFQFIDAKILLILDLKKDLLFAILEMVNNGGELKLDLLFYFHKLLVELGFLNVEAFMQEGKDV